jgi:hypothetical protein
LASVLMSRGIAPEIVSPFGSDPKRWLSAELERTISRYPRTIDFGSSNRQNDGHSERARIRRCYSGTMDVEMSTDLGYATGRFSRAIRFVLVNNRVPHTDQHCALCGCLLEKGYVRDSQTRLIYCDTRCFAGWAHEAAPVIKTRGRKAS